jgi:hypothetical protein
MAVPLALIFGLSLVFASTLHTFENQFAQWDNFRIVSLFAIVSIAIYAFTKRTGRR